MRIKARSAAALAGALAGMMTATAASAQLGGSVGAVIKIFGVGYAVKTFGPQINTFLNKILAENNVGGLPATKVVPILRVGAGTYIGAAQVAGDPDVVRTVQAVAEGELDLDRAQLRFLLPINSLHINKLPGRVRGVGVSALIDLHV